MIRRDFILRQVQEMAQMLARAIALRGQHEYDKALAEIRHALRTLGREGDTVSEQAESETPLGPEAWLELCHRHEDVIGPMQKVVGDLLREQHQVLDRMGRVDAAQLALADSVTLHLEAILTGSVPVTRELLDLVDQDIARLAGPKLTGVTWSRLVRYWEERGRYAEAEDALFDWLETGESKAATAGREFYDRLALLKEDELETGGFSREEVVSGRKDLERKALSKA